jgi:hypothetical protein
MNMTNQSSILKLARFGAVAAAALTLAGMVACGPKTATNTVTNTTATTTVATNAMAALTPPGGLAPNTGGLAPNGQSGNIGGPNGMAGPNGNVGPNGNSGPPGPMAENDNNNTGGDAAGNQQWDRATYSSCVPSAMQQGASPGGAARYCGCVVAQLDNLSLSQKEMLGPQAPELGAAVQACRPQAQGN